MALTTALTVASVAISGMGRMAMASAQESAARYNRQARVQQAEYNQQLAEREARIKREQARADADDKARQVERDLASIRAAFGSSGLAFTGTALDVFEDSATQGELAVNRVLYRGELRAQESDIDATLAETEAETARREPIQPYTSAAVLGTIGSAAKAGTEMYLNA